MDDLTGNPLAAELFDRAIAMAHTFINDREAYEAYGGYDFLLEVGSLVIVKSKATYPTLQEVPPMVLMTVINAAMTIGMILERRRIEGENLEKSIGETVV